MRGNGKHDESKVPACRPASLGDRKGALCRDDGHGAVRPGNGYRCTMLTQAILRENRDVRPVQYAATVVVLSAICIGVALLMSTDAPGGDADRVQARAIEAQRVHDADLPLLYAQINRRYFSGLLPEYVSVSR